MKLETYKIKTELDDDLVAGLNAAAGDVRITRVGKRDQRPCEDWQAVGTAAALKNLKVVLRQYWTATPERVRQRRRVRRLY